MSEALHTLHTDLLFLRWDVMLWGLAIFIMLIVIARQQ